MNVKNVAILTGSIVFGLTGVVFFVLYLHDLIEADACISRIRVESNPTPESDERFDVPLPPLEYKALRAGGRKGDLVVEAKKREQQLKDQKEAQEEAQTQRKRLVEGSGGLNETIGRWKDAFKQCVEAQNEVVPEWQKVWEVTEQWDKKISQAEESFYNQSREHDKDELGLRAKNQAAREELARVMDKHIQVRQGWEANRTQVELNIDRLRHKNDDYLEVARAESRMDADGKVLDLIGEGEKQCVIDLGRVHGVRVGMLFTVYEEIAQHKLVKGRVCLRKIHETVSECEILPAKEHVYYDPRSLYRRQQPTERYSKYTFSGDPRKGEVYVSELTDQTPERRRQDVISQRLPKERQQRDLAKEAQEGRLPPQYQEAGVEQVKPGDLVANAHFLRIVTPGEFQQQIREELAKLKDVPAARLVFVLSPEIEHEVYRPDLLRRAIERNRCVVHKEVTGATHYFVTSAPLGEAALSPPERLRFLESTLERQVAPLKGKKPEELKPAEARLLRTYQQVKACITYGVQVIAEDELSALFRQRARKIKLTQGGLVQPGRAHFYLAGHMTLRSRRETEWFITENDGIIHHQLTDEVQYVVVGSQADEEVKEAKQIGCRLLREAELPEFFGVPAANPRD